MEKIYGYAHEEDDCHQSTEEDHCRHKLEEQKWSSLREEACRLEQKRERERRYTSCDSKSSRENGSDARDMVTI